MHKEPCLHGRHEHCCNCNLCGRFNVPGCAPPISNICIPPVGESATFRQVQRLECKVNECVNATNGTLAKAQATLKAIQRCATMDGAFYGPDNVWTEQGYDEGSGSVFYITHVKPTKASGPIKMELHLAYGDTTNSKRAQDIFDVSEFELANVAFPAVPYNTDVGYYGKAVWRKGPIMSTEEDNLFTVGFTESGRMRYYANAIDQDQLRRDRIENAMGCYAVLVLNGEITDVSLRNRHANYQTAAPRVCMGQNGETKEIIFLSCGDYDTNGMTTAACANILRQYGCTIAVETCSGKSVSAADKGEILFPPSDAEIPVTHAYWFVTKKRTYCRDFTWEVALLALRVGKASWQGYLNSLAIKNLTILVNDAIMKVQELEDRVYAVEILVAELEARVKAIEDWQSGIEGDISDLLARLLKEIQDRIDGDDALRLQIEMEIADREAAVADLQAKLDQEVLDRIAGDAALRTDLNTEIQARIDGDADLLARIQQEISDRQAAVADLQSQIDAHTTLISNLRADLTALQTLVNDNYNSLLLLIQQNTTKINELEQRQAALETQMAALDATVTQILETITQIEVSLENLKQLYDNLLQRVIALETYQYGYSRTNSLIDGGTYDFTYTLMTTDDWALLLSREQEAQDAAIVAAQTGINDLENYEYVYTRDNSIIDGGTYTFTYKLMETEDWALLVSREQAAQDDMLNDHEARIDALENSGGGGADPRVDELIAYNWEYDRPAALFPPGSFYEKYQYFGIPSPGESPGQAQFSRIAIEQNEQDNQISDNKTLSENNAIQIGVHETQISNHETRISVLENATPPVLVAQELLNIVANAWLDINSGATGNANWTIAITKFGNVCTVRWQITNIALPQTTSTTAVIVPCLNLGSTESIVPVDVANRIKPITSNNWGSTVEFFNYDTNQRYALWPTGSDGTNGGTLLLKTNQAAMQVVFAAPPISGPSNSTLSWNGSVISFTYLCR